MTDNPALTMCALRGERMNRTLKTVENMLFAIEVNRKAFIVVISAYFASVHHRFLPNEQRSWFDGEERQEVFRQPANNPTD